MRILFLLFFLLSSPKIFSQSLPELFMSGFSQSNPFKNESIRLENSTNVKKQNYYSAGAGIVTEFHLKDFKFYLDDGLGILLTFNINNGISKYFKYSLGLDLLSVPGDGGAGIVNGVLWFNLPVSNKVIWLLGGGAGFGLAKGKVEGGLFYDLLIGTKIMYNLSGKNSLGFETKYSLAGKFLSYNIFVTF